jgi:hypothetical protein
MNTRIWTKGSRSLLPRHFQLHCISLREDLNVVRLPPDDQCEKEAENRSMIALKGRYAASAFFPNNPPDYPASDHLFFELFPEPVPLQSPKVWNCQSTPSNRFVFPSNQNSFDRTPSSSRPALIQNEDEICCFPIIPESSLSHPPMSFSARTVRHPTGVSFPRRDRTTESE